MARARPYHRGVAGGVCCFPPRRPEAVAHEPSVMSFSSVLAGRRVRRPETSAGQCSKSPTGQSRSGCLTDQATFLSSRSLPSLSGGVSGDPETAAGQPLATGGSSWSVERLCWLPLAPNSGWVGHGWTASQNEHDFCHLVLFCLCRGGLSGDRRHAMARARPYHRGVAGGECYFPRRPEAVAHGASGSTVMEPLSCPTSALRVASFSSVLAGRRVRRPETSAGQACSKSPTGQSGSGCLTD
jgi:hypothetical protein